MLRFGSIPQAINEAAVSNTDFLSPASVIRLLSLFLYLNVSASRGMVTAWRSASMTMRLSPLFCNSIHFLIAPRNNRRGLFSLLLPPRCSTEIVADVWHTGRLDTGENPPLKHLKRERRNVVSREREGGMKRERERESWRNYTIINYSVQAWAPHERGCQLLRSPLYFRSDTIHCHRYCDCSLTRRTLNERETFLSSNVDEKKDLTDGLQEDLVKNRDGFLTGWLEEKRCGEKKKKKKGHWRSDCSLDGTRRESARRTSRPYRWNNPRASGNRCRTFDIAHLRKLRSSLRSDRPSVSTSNLRTGDHLKGLLIPTRLRGRDAGHDDVRRTHAVQRSHRLPEDLLAVVFSNGLAQELPRESIWEREFHGWRVTYSNSKSFGVTISARGRISSR